MLVLLYFALTLFASATLLFLVQPMIGKMILPLLGGTPAVWNTCMVFFQAVLLAGYAYTHFVSTRLSRRSQLLLQAALLSGPFFVLPFSLGAWTPPADSNPILSVLWILTIVVGVPFFVVSTTAPLLQKWFGFTGHPAAKDPYFLYGASNLGSMLALVLYPLLIEPTFALPEQTVVWTIGYDVFAALVLGCIVMLLWRGQTAGLAVATSEPLPMQPAAVSEAPIAPRNLRKGLPPREPAPAPAPEAPGAKISWLRPVRWIALAAIPSSLFLSLTTYMTTDIAPIPFFWVIPLGIYLFTFILVFARWPVPWTAPRKPGDTSGSMVLGGFAILGAVLAGVSIHFIFAKFADPLTLGPSHAMYLAAALGAVALFTIRPGGGTFAAAIVGATALVVGFGVHLMYREQYGSFFVFGPSHILYFVLVLFLFVFWVTSGVGSPHDFVLFFQPCFLLFLVLYIVADMTRAQWLEILLHVVSFTFVTLLCHGELAKDRPKPEHLTQFYLCMSVGGVLGGLFNVFVAPFVFRYGLYEYPLVMVVACLLRPQMVGNETFVPGDSREEEPTWLGRALDIAIPIAIAAVVYFLVRVDNTQGSLYFVHDFDPRWDAESRRPALRSLLIVLPIVAVLALALRPIRFGLSVGLLWLVVGLYDDSDQNWILRDRSFFGIVKVKSVTVNADSRTMLTYHTLYHGGIDHGRQHVEPSRRHEPCSYFHPLTGIGQVFMKLTWPNTPLPATLDEFKQRTNPYHRFTLPSQRLPASLIGVGPDPWSALVATQGETPFAVIGLGTGTLAAYAKPYQTMDIYEIDPLVLRLSERVGDVDPPFTYLEDAKKRGANLKVILGDGRLKIKSAPDHWYHVIVLDAFASDAIPLHLLTVEAIQTYLDKLAPGGVLVFNTTNRYLRLNGVLKDIADELDLECLQLGNWETLALPEVYGTDFLLMRRNPAAIAKLGGAFNGGPPLAERLDLERYDSLMRSVAKYREGQGLASREGYWNWQPWHEPENHNGRLWTDSYSNLLGVLDLGR